MLSLYSHGDKLSVVDCEVKQGRMIKLSTLTLLAWLGNTCILFWPSFVRDGW